MEQVARHLAVIFAPDRLEPELLHDTSTAGMSDRDIRVQRDVGDMGLVPGDQGGPDLTRQPAPPQVTPNGVPQLPPVPQRPEPGPTHKVVIQVSHPPLREARRALSMTMGLAQ